MTRITMSGALFCLLFSLLLDQGNGYSAGPPDGRCADGYPHHRGTHGRSLSEDIATCPYEIMVDSKNYSLGQTIQVTVKTKDSSSGEMFTGFVIRAKRTTGDTDELLGTFSNVNESTTKPISFRAGSTSGKAPNCLSHNTNAPKAEITVTWTAPNENAGDIVIGGTLVTTKHTFYVGVETTLTPQEGSGDVNLGPVYTPIRDNSHFDFTGCGSDYGCLKSPGNYSNSDSSIIVSWKPDPDNDANIYYELRSDGTQKYDRGFVALGWSEDKLMGDDDTVTCGFDDLDMGNIHYGVNVRTNKLYNDRRRTEGFSKLYLKREDGIMYCSFSRPAEMTTYYWNNSQRQPLTFNQKTTEYYLQVAHGPAYSFDSPSKHDVPPMVSNEKWNFATSTSFQAFAEDEITNFSSGGNRNVAVLAVVFAAVSRYLCV